MRIDNDIAIIVPMANEEPEFALFTEELKSALDRLGTGRVYFIVEHYRCAMSFQRTTLGSLPFTLLKIATSLTPIFGDTAKPSKTVMQ